MTYKIGLEQLDIDAQPEGRYANDKAFGHSSFTSEAFQRAGGDQEELSSKALELMYETS